MTGHQGVSPSGQLRISNTAVATAFQGFRDAARTAGPLDTATVEFILLAGFSMAGQQEPFKNHAMRALKSGTSKEALQQAVIVTLGATSILPVVATSLRWLDEVDAEYRSSERA